MSIPKKHHYLPEFYLKGFCTGGELWVCDCEKDAYDKRRPETLAIRKGFYSVEDEHGNKDHAEVEKRLSVVENQAALAIRKLDAGDELRCAEKYVVALFAALLKFRIPAFERQMNEISSAVFDQEAMRKLVPNVEAVEGRLRQQGYDDSEDLRQQARLIYEKIQDEAYEVTPSQNMRVGAMLEYTRHIAQDFVGKPWTVARSSEGSSFIISDDPLVVVAPEGAPDPISYAGPGAIPPGYESWIPLNRRICLIIGNEPYGGQNLRLQKVEVRAVNVMLAAQCERFFMAGDEALLRRVARALPQKVTEGWTAPSSLSLPECLGHQRSRPSRRVRA